MWDGASDSATAFCVPNASVATERAFLPQTHLLFVVVLQTATNRSAILSRASLHAIKDSRSCPWSTFPLFRFYQTPKESRLITPVALQRAVQQPENRYANTHVCTRSVAQCAYTKPASINRWIVSYIHRDCPTTKVECCNTSCHRGESEGRTRWCSHQNVSQGTFTPVDSKQEAKNQ